MLIDALAVWMQPNGTEAYVLAAPLLAGSDEFGSAEVLSEAMAFIPGASAAFDPVTGTPVVAWSARDDTSERILVASRPAF